MMRKLFIYLNLGQDKLRNTRFSLVNSSRCRAKECKKYKSHKLRKLVSVFQILKEI